MLSGNYGPTAAEFQRSGGAGYAGWYARAKSHAIALDNHHNDTHHPGRVEFTCASANGMQGRTEVLLWDDNRQATVRFISDLVQQEPRDQGVLTTTKRRDIEMTSDYDRGLLKVEDRFTQDVHETVGDSRRDLVTDQRERVLVTSLDDGTVLASGPKDCGLLFDTGWSVSEYQSRKQDLGI